MDKHFGSESGTYKHSDASGCRYIRLCQVIQIAAQQHNE